MKKIVYLSLICSIFVMHRSQSSEIPEHKEENLTTLQRIKSQYIYENKGKIIAGTAALGALAYGAYNREKLLEHLNNLIKRYRSTPLKSSDIESRWNSLHFADQDDTNLNDAGSINNRYDESKRIKHFADEEDTDDTSKSTTEHSPVNHTILDETLNKKAVDEKNNDDFKDPYDHSPQSQSSQKKGDYFNDEIDHLQKKYSSNPDMIKRLENFREATNNNDIITALNSSPINDNNLTDSEQAVLRALFKHTTESASLFDGEIAKNMVHNNDIRYALSPYNKNNSENDRRHMREVYKEYTINKFKNMYTNTDDTPYYDESKEPSIAGRFKTRVHAADDNENYAETYSKPRGNGNYYNAYTPIKSREKVNKHFADEDDDLE